MSEENEQSQSNYLRAKKTLKLFSFFSLHGTKWNKNLWFFVKILLIKIALIKMK